MATGSSFASGGSGSRNIPSFAASSSSSSSTGVPGQAQPMVVVWEWQDDLGYWRPYTGQVSGYIEQCLQHQRGASTSSSISLGQADPSLAAYIIDIPNLKQFRQDTGKIRSVRQSLFPQTSALGSGVLWEWANDEGSWTPYEIRTSILLEHSYKAGQATADLSSHGYNYIVDLTALEQVNKSSSYRRRVRRQGSTPYPLTSGSVIHSGPSCTCQQCMSNSSTAGPMPSRLRHSFSAGQTNPPNLQTQHGRPPGTSPSSVYTPYPRRPLSMGNLLWNGPWGSSTSMTHPPGPPQTFGHHANGFSVPTIPLQLNGSSSVSVALAGMASILMSAAGLGVRFMTAPFSQRGSSRPTKAQSSSVKRAKRQSRTASQKPEEVIKKYMEKVPVIPDEDCIICMERLACPSGYEVPAECSQSLQPNTVGRLMQCGHTFHMLCMLAMYNNGTKDGSLQCPSCKTIYGEKTGTQPKGKMEIYSIPQSLPGHLDCGTIQIIYNIPPGIQGPEHPNPGQPYTCRGFPRFCFLPDNDKGRKVLELLKVAWTRRLIFTVGTSSTTGEPDTVIWNEIHHKTEMMSNVSGHGYPDPNYLDNVLSELASQGVTVECLKRDAQSQGAQGSAM
ncbi:probable E3 ubiquitin-protein ligase DTX2 isoform X1 [Myxocyprinus asiaticus]|uniref:probable E3 ubiquitin-protein ligase DTX2 isoform X1 n=1 Tax=Myxocyprinus asiaticus TaxID=70543 RepID=UPI0022221676|nr:probable E3 ubiquitin-protein ligase DTX2 isoform X1 [Myxocyprinus asiaticus]XP_051514791.1 probable E3 ubiquitin-protein ligase DTX2 isoform X1 [Myxocyprinus asiaticus]XP_051514801.1 probable E3 ubiquitin-protein ligase DTX2 isoform X1 [Myxocyprinus asiaticus]XP_051514810.1 probable E3 ubiquitin-protein ligase DTX2 isoform X1 [Myxocyprinus asiaticus]